MLNLYDWGLSILSRMIRKPLTPTSVTKSKEHLSFHILLSTDKEASS